MLLTSEQTAIIQSQGNILINAVAGSGKTSTLIEYAKTRPKHCKLLYIAFNKTVKDEAQRKFAKAGLHNVNVETSHSLAFRYVVRGSEYKVRNSYKTHELVQLLGLRGQAERHVEYIAANHILRFAAYFCNSNKSKVQELNYRDLIADSQALSFVNSCYEYLEKQTRVFLSKMEKAEIDITHDFYLKKFQLQKHQLPYQYILFDEGQDASEAMLDVFLNQAAIKIIVGDTHQQIYGWRHAVNSLEKVDFPCFQLSQSFRFNQDIANLASKILDRKELLGKAISLKIIGSGNNTNKTSKAILARGNLTLLLRAIHYINEHKKPLKLHFEGKFSSYTYAEDGASLYDVLNLSLGKRFLIRDALVKEMKNMNELEDYVDKTEDAQLGMMLEIVKKYGTKIPAIIKDIKDMHVDEREDADIIFSTVHRCKGMEYDEVELSPDFSDLDDVLELQQDKKATELQKVKLFEEINLLYVAITRTRNSISIPEKLMPDNHPESANIHVIEENEEEDELEELAKIIPITSKWDKRLNKSQTKTEPTELAKKAYSVDELRKTHKTAYKPWSADQDAELIELFCEGATFKEMAEHFGRTTGAITSRIAKLDLEQKYG
jgi:superfamily I DNA/RNA helicase